MVIRNISPRLMKVRGGGKQGIGNFRVWPECNMTNMHIRESHHVTCGQPAQVPCNTIEDAVLVIELRERFIQRAFSRTTGIAQDAHVDNNFRQVPSNSDVLQTIAQLWYGTGRPSNGSALQ